MSKVDLCTVTSNKFTVINQNVTLNHENLYCWLFVVTWTTCSLGHELVMKDRLR